MLTKNDAVSVVENIASRATVRNAKDFERDGILHCGKCGEPRQAWINWFPDKDGNPTKNLVRIMCKCDMEAEKEVKERKAQADFDDAMRTIRMALHTQRDDVRWRFDMDDGAESKVSMACRAYVDKWDDVRKGNMGILFYGNKGCGKTFYASCIYNALKDKRILVGFSSAPNLMSVLGKWDKTEIFDAITRPLMLVIDDIGAERDNSYSAELMYSVIDARYKTGKPTIVTTNLDIDEMKREQDRWRSRIYDRIIEMCPVTIPMVGSSRRTTIADERRKNAMELLGLTGKGNKR